MASLNWVLRATSESSVKGFLEPPASQIASASASMVSAAMAPADDRLGAVADGAPRPGRGAASIFWRSLINDSSPRATIPARCLRFLGSWTFRSS